MCGTRTRLLGRCFSRRLARPISRRPAGGGPRGRRHVAGTPTSLGGRPHLVTWLWVYTKPACRIYSFITGEGGGGGTRGARMKCDGQRAVLLPSSSRLLFSFTPLLSPLLGGKEDGKRLMQQQRVREVVRGVDQPNIWLAKRGAAKRGGALDTGALKRRRQTTTHKKKMCKQMEKKA